MNTCPDCGKSILMKAKRCSCGWSKVEQKFTAPDYRCQYAIANRRCPVQGIICPYPYGNGPWYCREHWHTLNEPRLAEAALIHAEMNDQKIKELKNDNPK